MGELRVLGALTMLLHKLSIFLGQLVAVLGEHSEGDGYGGKFSIKLMLME